MVEFQSPENERCAHCSKVLEKPFILWTFNKFNLCLCLECGRYLSLHLASDTVYCEQKLREFKRGYKFCRICREVKHPVNISKYEDLCDECDENGYADTPLEAVVRKILK